MPIKFSVFYPFPFSLVLGVHRSQPPPPAPPPLPHNEKILASLANEFSDICMSYFYFANPAWYSDWRFLRVSMTSSLMCSTIFFWFQVALSSHFGGVTPPNLAFLSDVRTDARTDGRAPLFFYRYRYIYICINIIIKASVICMSAIAGQMAQSIRTKLGTLM